MVDDDDEEEEEGEEEAGELSALEYISSEDRVHSSRTNFLMDVESGRRFVLEIGDFVVDRRRRRKTRAGRFKGAGRFEGAYENDETKKKFVARPWLLFCDEEEKRQQKSAPIKLS